MTHIILSILVGIIIILNTLVLLSTGGQYEHALLTKLISEHPIILSAYLWIQLPVIYLWVWGAYIHPIQKLSREIAAFVTGVRDEPVGLAANAWSRGMNYITTFFIRSLQILKVFKGELRSGRQLKSEVDIASEIQQITLEHGSTVIPSLRVAYAIKSAAEVGGDSCDIIEGVNGNHYLYVGDATGHGVPSGFIMMMVNSLISGISQMAISGAQILALTNKIVKPRVKQNMLMSCVLLRWNESEKKMYFTGAGHEYLLVYKRSENKVFPIKSGGVAIGMLRDSTKILKEQQILLSEGDIILLYTDGISEARYQSAQSGILFGHDRIVESMMKVQEKTVEMIFAQVTTDLSAFMGYKHRQYDDITLMVIQYAPGAGAIIKDLPEKIDTSYITEWNWIKKEEKK